MDIATPGRSTIVRVGQNRTATPTRDLPHYLLAGGALQLLALPQQLLAAVHHAVDLFPPPLLLHPAAPDALHDEGGGAALALGWGGARVWAAGHRPPHTYTPTQRTPACATAPMPSSCASPVHNMQAKLHQEGNQWKIAGGGGAEYWYNTKAIK